MLQDRVDKICEMATVMNRSIELDDRAQSQEREIMSRLITENKVITFNFHSNLRLTRFMLNDKTKIRFNFHRQTLTLKFQIEDTARKQLTRLKKSSRIILRIILVFQCRMPDIHCLHA